MKKEIIIMSIFFYSICSTFFFIFFARSLFLLRFVIGLLSSVLDPEGDYPDHTFEKKSISKSEKINSVLTIFDKKVDMIKILMVKIIKVWINKY